jgi:calnexin
MTIIESTKQDVSVINWRVYRYEVKFENGQECGGAYVKLLTKDTQGDLHQFMDKTPYTIMFGPDKCGLDNKVSWGYC